MIIFFIFLQCNIGNCDHLHIFENSTTVLDAVETYKVGSPRKMITLCDIFSLQFFFFKLSYERVH